VTYYCDEADLYEYGVPRGGLPNPARIVTVNTSTEVFSLDGHGFRADTQLLFRAESGGSLPSPLAAGTTYYAIPVTSDTFRVSTSASGSAVNITTPGTNVLVSTPLPTMQSIAWASEMIDNMLVGNVAPFSPVPAIVRAACADLAATRLLQLTGGATVDLAAKLASTNATLSMWRKTGSPLPANAGQASANLAVVASANTIRWGANTI
jgi:phage gp36-like protein